MAKQDPPKTACDGQEIHEKLMDMMDAKLEDIQAFIKDKDINVNLPSQKGSTLLIEATKNLRVDFLSWLLENTDVDVNQRDADGNTALHHLSHLPPLEHEHSKQIRQVPFLQMEILVQKGAQVDAFNKDHLTPLMLACTTANRAAVELFVSQGGANVNLAGSGGMTPLHFACLHCISAFDDRHIQWLQLAMEDCIQWLVQHGKANVDALADEGILPIHYFLISAELFSHYREIAQWLLLQGNADSIVHIVLNPLHITLEYEDPLSFIQTILDRATNKDTAESVLLKCVNEKSQTLLHKAVEHNNLPVVEYLLSLCSSPDFVDALDSDGRTALAINLKLGRGVWAFSSSTDPCNKIMEYLVVQGNASLDCFHQSNVSESPIHLACAIGLLQMTIFLLKKDPESVNTSFEGFTPLGVAAIFGRTNIVEWLLENADPNFQHEDWNGSSVLHKVIEFFIRSYNPEGCSETAKILVEKCEADVNAQDQHGATPFLKAIAFSPLSLIMWMIVEAGADVNAIADAGMTPLMLAVNAQREDLVEWWLSENPTPGDSQIRNAYGHTAGEMAMNSSNARIKGLFDCKRRWNLVRYLVEKELLCRHHSDH